MYNQGGRLPIGVTYMNKYMDHVMIGEHADPIIEDSYFSDVRGFDVQKAFKAMKESATKQHRVAKLFNKYGYVPADKAAESVSKTLEIAYDDWCIAQLAKALEKRDDYKTYSKRASYYQHLYNPKTGFFQPKLASGEWKTPFNPIHEPKNGRERDYTEANAWQYLWYVPQNVPKLIHLMGGRQAFVRRLDTLFAMSSRVKGGVADMSGMIGQYVQGNEPDQHVRYLYDYAGAPWKTQYWVRYIMDNLYGAKPDGLPGNDDMGQMSAWYVFSAMGFYPVNPASGVFAIGSPIFPKVTINLKGNKTFTIIAHNVSRENKYIQSAELNGKTYNKPYITYKDIIQGSTLEFNMGPKPNKQWGTSKQDSPPITAFTEK
jgi:predicted alpha-1,2-mannosidase